MSENIKITDIRCPNCGGPAFFDIPHQTYLCRYCGSSVGIKDANLQVHGLRQLQMGRIKNSAKNYKLASASCSGCGATLVFQENEALSNCAFCGRSLVRKDYLETTELPENMIPFALTEEEAKTRLADWCDSNRSKQEAKHVRKLLGNLKGFYLPYELIRGPVHMNVSRMDGGSTFDCEGYINDEFVNRSKQLDNLLLDGMEPFDLDALTEFNFGYVAGHRVKISDISDDVLKNRVTEETEVTYTPSVRKILETRAVDVSADVSSAMRLPVLLPVYYVADGETMAAVNGQTGKVSVRAEKESHYYFLPWWLKAILATLGISLVLFLALFGFGMSSSESLFLTGITGFFFAVVTLCLFSDTTRNSFSVESGRKIFTSGAKSFVRERGRLVQSDKILERKVMPPVFFKKLDGVIQPVALRFTSPMRIVRIVLLCIVALFLPVILALFINGFDFGRLELGGSAAWFCTIVPVVPIFLLKFGIVELYERPWIYTFQDNGKTKRYRNKLDLKISKDMVLTVLRALFIPPVSLAVWFGILCFFTMVYLTAFGFGD
ncbi:MAG: hypothetical protein IJ091_02760 [Oscillospiraceae bacterium]|nr:hypothetical protein [Oscillospiraceae bacterium]